MSPLITVYILAYNRPDYLRECLESVARQTLRDFRVIVLDDNSPTSLQPVAKEFNELVVEYRRNPCNLRLFGNFYQAWHDPKTTPYFVIFHDDDLMHPQFLERSLKMICHPSLPAWAGSSSLEFQGEPPAFPNLGADSPHYLKAADLAHGLLTGRLKVTHSSAIYRTELTSSLELQPLIDQHHIAADRPIFFALAEHRGCALSSLPLVLYRYHSSQSIKISPLSEDNLLALFTTYRRVLQPIWSPAVERDFYVWSGYQIPDGYGRLAVTQRTSFHNYLRKARELRVYRDRFLWNYLSGSLRHFFVRLGRAPAKVRKNLMKNYKKVCLKLRQKTVFDRIKNLTLNLGYIQTGFYLLQTIRCKIFKMTKTFQLQSKDAQYPLQLRNLTSDKTVFDQIFIKKQYSCFDKLSKVIWIIDCGANVGLASVYFLNKFPCCRIICVEPDPGNFEVLIKNLAPYKTRAFVVRAAVWSHPTGLTFENRGSAFGSEYGIKVRECKMDEKADIHATTVKELLQEFGIERVSILKMDIEGSEFCVFSGACKTWLDCVENMAIEFHDSSKDGESAQLATQAILADKKFVTYKSGELTVFETPTQKI